MGNIEANFNSNKSVPSKPKQTKNQQDLKSEPKTRPIQSLKNDQRLSLSHPHILKTLIRQNNDNSPTYYYELCQISLQTLLSERLGTKKYFPEEDLQALEFGIVSALSYLQEKGIPHGDLSNREIFFDQSCASFKIIDSDFVNGKGFGLRKFLTQGQFIPISPEIFQLVCQQPQNMMTTLNQLPDQYWFKNDIWCLGMALLEAMTLKSSQDIYQFDRIRYDLIQQRLIESAMVYQPLLSQTTAIMLSANIDERPDALSLFNILRKQQSSLEHPIVQNTTNFSLIPQIVQPNFQTQLYPQTSYQQFPQVTQQPPQGGTQQFISQPSQQLTSIKQISPVSQPQYQQASVQQLPQIPIKQLVKKLIFPDGHVEYQVINQDQAFQNSSQEGNIYQQNPQEQSLPQQPITQQTLQPSSSQQFNISQQQFYNTLQQPSQNSIQNLQQTQQLIQQQPLSSPQLMQQNLQQMQQNQLNQQQLQLPSLQTLQLQQNSQQTQQNQQSLTMNQQYQQNAQPMSQNQQIAQQISLPVPQLMQQYYQQTEQQQNSYQQQQMISQPQFNDQYIQGTQLSHRQVQKNIINILLVST